MKKLLIALMALTLCVALVACGNDDVANTTDAVVNDTAVETTEETAAETTGTPDAELTNGQVHANAFVEMLTLDAGLNVEQIANDLLALPVNQFMGGAMPVDPAYFPGFDNFVPTGYKSGVMFMPMIGSIPYVGYVFELEEGTDANAFVTTLKDNCNPRWNICVTADEIITEVVGNKVLFLMCPASNDMPAEGGDMGGMAL